METGSTGLAPQVFGLPFLEHSNELLYPRGPVDPDVTRWGWGRSPASGLAASDKNPREEFTAPFNTVIIFPLSVGGGCSCLECRHPSLQEDAQGVASLQDNFLGKPYARKGTGKGRRVVLKEVHVTT